MEKSGSRHRSIGPYSSFWKQKSWRSNPASLRIAEFPENVISCQNLAIQIKKNWHKFTFLEGQNCTFPLKMLFTAKYYFGRMIEISGSKHFWLHTRNTSKNWLFALYLLSKTSTMCPLIVQFLRSEEHV